MKLLSVETATEACSAALMINDDIISRYQVAPRKHTELILPMCDELMHEAGIETAQLDAVAFGRGPGSFTGVRIAAGVAQGIALAHDLPVVPVSTLAAMAQQVIQAGQSTHVLAAIDARMNEVYWGAYMTNDNGLATLYGEELVTSPADVPIPDDGAWFGAGSGWQAYTNILESRLSDRVSEYDQQLFPKAEFIAVLARQDFMDGMAVVAENAMPVYLRNNVASRSQS